MTDLFQTKFSNIFVCVCVLIDFNILPIYCYVSMNKSYSWYDLNSDLYMDQPVM